LSSRDRLVSVRLLAVVTILALGGCLDVEDTSCGKCPAIIHFNGKVGIPSDVDSVSVGICHVEVCTELDVAIPEQAISDSAGADPSLAASIQRTDDLAAPDLQGVFLFDAVWTSSKRRLGVGQQVAFSVSRSGGSSVVAVGHDVQAAERDACGCGRVELSP
jgi:hypothetical protein